MTDFVPFCHLLKARCTLTDRLDRVHRRSCGYQPTRHHIQADNNLQRLIRRVLHLILEEAIPKDYKDSVSDKIKDK
jgi:hypothetical protein